MIIVKNETKEKDGKKVNIQLTDTWVAMKPFVEVVFRLGAMSVMADTHKKVGMHSLAAKMSSGSVRTSWL